MVSGEAVAVAAWCPFCTALKPTLTEEIEATDAVVFAKVLGPGQLTEDGFDRKMRLEVRQILKGKSFVALEEVFETIAPASLEAGQECLVMGVLTDRMMWSTPMKLTDRSREYILAVQTLPLAGPERIRFFLEYLEDAESFMAYDAYDEFARTPYDDVKAIKPHMSRDKLVGWVQDPEVSINRKRLYFTLLGVCGGREDLPLLEKMITSPDKRDRAALDSLIACYLTLSGADGVKLIEDRFLRDKEADYVDTYAAVAALRFHGTESDVIPVPRIVEAVRLLLDRPEVADLVIADLARWKDWTVTDRLVEMFKNANEKTQWVRVPIVHFLRVNPDPAAKAKIEELKAVDAQSVRRALAFFELEAAMQTEAEEEDADFERQLKELEAEKQKEENKKKEIEKGTGGDEKGGSETGDVQEKPPGKLDPGAGREPEAGLEPNSIEGLSAASMADGGQLEQGVDRVVSLKPAVNDAAALVPSVELGSEPAVVETEAVQLVSATAPELETPELETPGLETPGLETPVVEASVLGASVSAAAGVERRAVQGPVVGLSANAVGSAQLPVPSAAGRLATGPLASEPLQEASSPDNGRFFWWVLGLPVAVNLVLLVMAWSILNGTFSRLFS